MVKRIAFSAIALALTVICLYGAAAFSTGRIAALALASLFCGICVNEYGVRYGAALYVGASILSLLFIPSRMYALIYIVFVGYYPIVKLYIERLRKLWAEWILKVLYFNAVLLLLYILFKAFFMPGLNPGLAALILQYIGLIIAALEIIFVVYDLALSYMIGYFNQFLRRMNHA